MDPKVGIGVFVFNGAGKFVIGKRKGSLGAGTCIQYPINPLHMQQTSKYKLLESILTICD
jgi:mannose-6-phosphate isomerase-like protein (cupin superfamily)